MQLKTREITWISLFIVLAIITPIVFHLFGAGLMFLPMFLPIILSGYFLDLPGAILVGLLAPWVSGVVTGMPPLIPVAPIITVQVVSAVSMVSYLYHRKRIHYFLCLVAGIVAERFSLILMMYLVAPLLNLPPKLLSWGSFIYSLPGIVLQLFVIPVVLLIVWKLEIIPGKT